MYGSLIRIALFICMAVFVIEGVALWYGMSIYPDEFAFRIHLGRFIQDKGIVEGLYALCSSGHKTVPWLFIPSAWLVSWVSLALDPTQMRIISIMTVISCAMMAGYYSLRTSQHYAYLWLSAVAIGVAGSSLVFARHEFILFLNIFCSILVFYCLQHQLCKLPKRIFLSCALLFSLLCSVYSHPQGIVYLPLTAYLLYRINYQTQVNIPIIVLGSLGIGYIIYAVSSFYDLACPAYPEIEEFWKKMIFHLDGLNWEVLNGDGLNTSLAKLDNYLSAFTYNVNYSVSYLPGVTSETLNGLIPHVDLNAIIRSVLILVVGLNSIALLVVVGIVTTAIITRKKMLFGLSLDVVMVYAMIVAPTFLLFGIDVTQNFYRSIALHFLFTVALVILLSNIHVRLVAYVINIIGIIIFLVAGISLLANFHIFFWRIHGYEGPSILNSTDWLTLRRDVNALAQKCAVDVTTGGGVVDDFSYETLKQYQHLYPITYLGLQMNLTHMQADEMVRRIKANYVIAHCSSMQATGIGWPPMANKGILCCTKFNYLPQEMK